MRTEPGLGRSFRACLVAAYLAAGTTFVPAAWSAEFVHTDGPQFVLNNYSLECVP